MAVHLLDVNVLIALAWSNHVHHDDAHRWFDAQTSGGWATCPLTQCGFVRVSSNPRAVLSNVSTRQSVEALRRFTSHPRHEFWPDEVSVTDEARFSAGRLTGHQQVTDAYLLSLARARGGRLATLDRALSALAASSTVGDSGDAVVVIPLAGGTA